MQSSPILVLFILGCFVLSVLADNGLSCSSCGDECLESCGTRHFRTCCFNYLRKRSQPPQPLPMYDDFRDSPGYVSRSQIEKMIRNAILRQETYNTLDRDQGGKNKAGFTDPTPSPQLKLAVGGNGRDQVHVIYDI